MRRFKVTREFYVSNMKLWKNEGEAEIYIPKDSDKLSAMGFRSKRQQKPAFHYRFRSEKRRDEYVKDFFENIERKKEQKAKKNEERKSYIHDCKVGDIFSSSWGYDQTNCDFVQVVSVTDKSVRVREIAQNAEQTGYLSGYTKPIKDAFVKESRLTPNGKPVTKKVSINNCFCFESFRYFFKYDGVALYWSAYA